MSNVLLAMFYDMIGQDDKAKKVAGVTDTKSKNEYRKKVIKICYWLAVPTLGLSLLVAARKKQLIREDGG